jgi:hypothetical protein
LTTKAKSSHNSNVNFTKKCSLQPKKNEKLRKKNNSQNNKNTATFFFELRAFLQEGSELKILIRFNILTLFDLFFTV